MMLRWTWTAFVFNPQPSPAVNPRLNWSLGGSRCRLKYSEPFVTNRAAPDLLCINRGPVELCIGDQMNSASLGDQYIDSCIGEACIVYVYWSTTRYTSTMYRGPVKLCHQPRRPPSLLLSRTKQLELPFCVPCTRVFICSALMWQKYLFCTSISISVSTFWWGLGKTWSF